MAHTANPWHPPSIFGYCSAVDVDAERERLAKQLTQLQQQHATLSKNLATINLLPKHLKRL